MAKLPEAPEWIADDFGLNRLVERETNADPFYVHEALLDAKRDGTLKTRKAHYSGDRSTLDSVDELPKEFWNETDRVATHGYGDGSKFWQIEVHRQSLLDWLGTSKERFSRQVGGRPTLHDWDGMWIEVAMIVANRALPKKQADLGRRLEKWFDDNSDRDPPDSDIRKKVSRLYKRIREN